jgi:hypothetical protein
MNMVAVRLENTRWLHQADKRAMLKCGVLVGEEALLRVSPILKVYNINIKLNPQYFGPFMIVSQAGGLVQSMMGLQNGFHASMPLKHFYGTKQQMIMEPNYD